MSAEPGRVHAARLLARHGVIGSAEMALSLLGLRPGVGLALRPGVALALGTQNAAPLFVFGYWHPALDADAHPLAWFGIARKEPFQKGHEVSTVQLLPETKEPGRRFAESSGNDGLGGQEADHVV